MTSGQISRRMPFQLSKFAVSQGKVQESDEETWEESSGTVGSEDSAHQSPERCQPRQLAPVLAALDAH